MSNYLEIKSGFGVCNEQNFPELTNLVTKQYFNNKISNSNLIIGEIRMYTGTTLPTGWLFCDGRTLKRSEYPELSKVIGSSYGGDNDSFNLPDFRRKIPIGSNLDKTKPPLTINYQGNSVVTGGDIKINKEQLPSHTHTINHTHKGTYTVQNWGKGDNANAATSNAAGTARNQPRTDTKVSKSGEVGQTNTNNLETGPTGNSADFLPPFCVVNIIIYAGN